MAGESFLQDIWQELCQSIGVPLSKHRSGWDDLVNRYSERQRHYHTLSHVKAIITTLRQHEDSLRSPEKVYIAAFFHDVVYDPRSSNNEQQSADLSGEFLRAASIDSEFAHSVEQLILATASHTTAEVSGDAAWFLDADLQIPWG